MNGLLNILKHTNDGTCMVDLSGGALLWEEQCLTA